MPSRRARVAFWLATTARSARLGAALVGELHADRIRGTPTLPALGSLPSEKENLTEDEKQPGHFNPYPLSLYGGGPGGMISWSVRYQGELLGLWDPQNRDLRRKPPPETVKSVG